MCHILVSKKCQLQAGTIHPYWGKELLTQQLTGSSTQTQPCDNAMSMVRGHIFSISLVHNAFALFVVSCRTTVFRIKDNVSGSHKLSNIQT